MASNIEWTDATPNPVVGCTKKSDGCKNCYAIRMAWRLMHSPHEAVRKKYEGTVHKTTAGALNWTGRINFDDKAMRKVIADKKPKMWFVNSMGDLFHPSVTFAQIDVVFAAFAIAHWHTFQVLTKHPERALQWFNYKDKSWQHEGMQGDQRIRYQTYHHYNKQVDPENWKWPLKNVWLGTSVENQEAAVERIPQLMKCPASVHFLSCEPLLGAVNITNKALKNAYSFPTGTDPLTGKGIEWTDPGDNYIGVDWVITGGESGPRARPMHPEWVRSLRDQCENSGSMPAFFFKQWGEYSSVLPADMDSGQDADFYMNENGKIVTEAEAIKDGGSWKGIFKLGKHRAGRLLDGERYDNLPIKK